MATKVTTTGQTTFTAKVRTTGQTTFVKKIVMGTPVRSVTQLSLQFAALSDTAITNASDNQIIIYDSALQKFVNTDSASLVNLTLSGNVKSNLIPDQTGIYDLGSSDYRWNDLYLSDSGEIRLGDLTIKDSGGVFTISDNLGSSAIFDLSGSISQIREMFSASGDLSYEVATGQFSIDVEEIYTKANFDSDLGAALDGGTGITYDSGTDTVSITDTGVIAGTYGSATQIPVFTVNAQGQLDSSSSVTVAGVTNFAWDSSTSKATITTADGGSFPATINGFGNDQILYFGDANDLQIYSNGVNSFISEGGVGDLVLQGTNIRLENGAGEYYLRTYNNNKVELYYDNSKKLETTDSGITVTGLIVGNYAGFDSDLTQKSTSDLSEGSNLYYTTARADSDAKNAISVTDNGGDGNLSYTPATGVISYTGPSASEVRAHINVVDAGGDGSFTYDSALGKLTYTGPSASEVRAHFSAAGDLTYDSATGQFSFDVENVYTSANFDSDLSATLSADGGLSYDSATQQLTIIDTGVIAATYGSTTQIPVLTINTKGQIDSAGTVTVAGVTGTSYDSATGQITINTADGSSFIATIGGFQRLQIDSASITNISGSSINYDSGVFTTLARAATVDSATYGSATEVPVLTVNTSGFIDSIGTVTVAGVTNFAWDSSTSKATITTADGASFPATINGFGNNQRLYFGDANDLQIYNNGTNSIIAEGGIGDLVIQGGNIRLENGSGEYYLRTYNNGKVELYYDNSKKLETTASGVAVTGQLTADSATFTNLTRAATVDSAIYGSTTTIPVLTVNTSGFIDSIGTVSVAGVTSTSFDSSTGIFTINTADGNSFTTHIQDSADLVRISRSALSATDTGGDGSFSYNTGTGVFTYTGPSATETRAHMVAGTGVTYDSSTGVISIGQDVSTTSDVTFGAVTGDSAIFGEVAFNTSFHDSHVGFREGALWYDPHHKNLNYYTDFDHPIEIGLQMIERVYNNTGAQIDKGKPLYYSGNRITEDGREAPTVALANATSATKYNVQGLAAENIPNNSYGQIVVAGVIDRFDTSGLNAGENFFAGLTDGAVQNAPPVYPNYPMCLGWVIKSDAIEGKVIINQQNHSVNTFRVQGDAHIGDDLRVDGDLIVNGTQTITSTENVSIGGNIQYLNAGNTIGEAGTTFVGTGLDDAFYSGHYSGDSSTKSFFVKIDATGTPDTFEWGFDSSIGTQATGIAITGEAQILDSDAGISIDFGATTGHTVGDKWVGSATAVNTDTGLFSNKNEGDAGNGYTHVGVYWDASQNEWTFVGQYDSEPEAPINRSAPSFAYGDVRGKDFYGTNFNGALVGNANTATEAVNVAVSANNTTDETVYLTFVDGATGTQGIETDTGLSYNPSSGLITSTGFSGSGANLTSLPASQLTGTIDSARIPSLAPDDIHGTFATGQIPDLATSKITSGIFDSARIPSLAPSDTHGTFSTGQIPDLNASKITSGIFDSARIPSLAAADITTGVFDSARIPSLATADITTGVFDSARIPFIPGGDADTLDGVNSTQFLRSDQNDETSGILTVNNTLVSSKVDGGILSLQEPQTSISAGGNLGAIQFQAPNEVSGGTSDHVTAQIQARAAVQYNGLNADTHLIISLMDGSEFKERVRIYEDGDLRIKGKLELDDSANGYITTFTPTTDRKGVTIDGQINADSASFTGDVSAGTFTGSGANLTSLPASQLTGTIDSARIPSLAPSDTHGTFATGQIPDLATSKITSGVFDSARIPLLAAADITSGIFDSARIPSLAPSDIHGTFATGQIPDLATSKITSGIFDSARIPSLAPSDIHGTFATGQIPDLNASKITSGTIDSARIPSLAAADIHGTFATGQIPDLNASKITSGIFDSARIPGLSGTDLVTGIIDSDRLPAGTFTTGGVTVGGSDTQVQFNDGGSLGGNAGMTFNKNTGVFTATAKSFDIEHPTKEGMRLRYGSLEGPENGVYVRGRTTSNIIELPDYWIGLVDEDTITVELTSIGKHQQLYVKDIKDNKIVIDNNLIDKKINCFYVVYGERKDVEKIKVEY